METRPSVLIPFSVPQNPAARQHTQHAQAVKDADQQDHLNTVSTQWPVAVGSPLQQKSEESWSQYKVLPAVNTAAVIRNSQPNIIPQYNQDFPNQQTKPAPAQLRSQPSKAEMKSSVSLACSVTQTPVAKQHSQLKQDVKCTDQQNHLNTTQQQAAVGKPLKQKSQDSQLQQHQNEIPPAVNTATVVRNSTSLQPKISVQYNRDFPVSSKHFK